MTQRSPPAQRREREAVARDIFHTLSERGALSRPCSGSCRFGPQPQLVHEDEASFVTGSAILVDGG